MTEILTSMAIGEFIYNRRDTISLSDASRIHPLIGCKISMASIKSFTTESQLVVERTASSKFVEISTQESIGSLSFLSKKKPGPIVTKTNSNFVSKIVANENMAKVMSNSTGESFYFFYNVGKALCWTDYEWKLKNPLSVIYFKDNYVTCHDVNLLIRDAMNAVIGFTTGDILCFWPLSGKYIRLNRQGLVLKSAVTCIQWIPGSENLFIAGFEDGSLMMFDKDMDDQNYTIPTSTENYFFTIAPKGSKHNPRMYWKISQKSIAAIAFSPDFQHIAVASLDGTLNIIDHRSGDRLDVYKSFFGGFTCVAWSPDGKFIVAGSQDDLISLFAFRGRLLARFQGHYSWPTGISFDERQCSDRHFRFGSVGEDTRVLFWDFSLGSLRRAKAPTIVSKTKSNMEIARKLSLTDGNLGPVFHNTLGTDEVPMIEPISSYSIGSVPLTSIVCKEDGFVVGDRNGWVTIFSRAL